MRDARCETYGARPRHRVQGDRKRSPEFQWELNGEVNNVCFPTGAVVIKDILYIYYGAADERIACASVDIHTLITELQKYAP